MVRIILHIDMDAFFAQIEERENPRFKGKPLVVGADPKGGRGRGVVSTANYEARTYGIHSALPISRAFKLNPKAIFLPVNMELYRRVSDRIMEIIKSHSPKWQVVSVDEAYLDISYLGDFKKAETLARKMKKEILEKEKLTCTIGIGENKLAAKIAASLVKPDGLLVIVPNQTRSFLSPLDIEKLPGIGPKTAEVFREMEINKIGEITNLSKEKLKGLFGKWGEAIFEKARGIDEDEVSSEEIVKSIGKEITFEKDTRDPEIILKSFEEIIKGVYGELGTASFSFKTVTVVCRFQGFETHTKAKTLKGKSRDLSVLRKTAKMLLLSFLVSNPKPVRLVGVRVSGLNMLKCK